MTDPHPHLRAAVDASLAWYDALCALHGVPCSIDGGLWVAHTAPPPLHSAVKTVEPGVGTDAAVRALEPRWPSSIADSFGHLAPAGMDLLFEARWLFHPGADPGGDALPAGWSRVGHPDDLRVWTAQHDTGEVLLPGLLDRSSFTVLARRDPADQGAPERQAPVAGAVVHLAGPVTSLSNVWAAPGHDLDLTDLIRIVAALHPGRAITGYESGADLDRALDAGFVDVGPQLVWVPRL